MPGLEGNLAFILVNNEWKDLMRRQYRLTILLVPLTLLAITVGAFAQSANLSPLLFLPGDSGIKPAAFEQKEPVIAQGGNGFLAVWTDARTDAGRISGSYYDGNGSEIYAARLDASGNLLDTTPVIISQGAADQARPQVAWNGQNWLVAWLSQQPTQGYWAWQVMAARVSPQGTVLDSQPLQLTNFSNSSSAELTVGSDGNNWAIFWQGNAGGENDLKGARISAQGAVLDPGGIVIVPAAYYLRFSLDVAFAQDEFLLVWEDLSYVQGLRLRTDLSRLDANPFNIAPGDHSSDTHVASNGADFFVVWEENVSTTYYEAIKGARVNHAGQVQDPSSIPIYETFGGYIGRSPRVAWGGSNWLVSFTLNGITVLRVSTSGTVLDPNNMPADFDNTSNKWSPESSPVPGGGIQLVWRDTRTGGSFPGDIYTAKVMADRTFGQETAISNGAPSQDRVSAAANGNGHMLAFRSDISGARRIMAQPVDANGAVLWPEPVLIASGPSFSAPAIAWNGSLYLVVWNDPSTKQIYARRLKDDGTLPDAAPITVMPGHSPDVAALGDTFLVVGAHTPSDPHFQFPFAVRVRGLDGAVLDSPIQIGQYFAEVPAISAFNDRWIAVWERHPSHDDPAAEIRANFIFPNGAIGTEFPVQSDFYTVRFHYNPDVATNGATALVVWSDPRAGNSNWNIYGRRLQSDGALLDTSAPLAISTAPNNQGLPAAAWDGNQFVVAYEDRRAMTFFMDPRTDIFATRVNANGQVLDPDGLAIFSDGMPEIFPAAAGANGQALLAASVYRNVSPHLAYRVGLRILGGGTVAPTLTPTNSPTPAPTNTPALTPTNTPTLAPTKPPRSTPTPTNTPAPTQPPASTIHSGDLDGSSAYSSKNYWNATVVIWAHGGDENPVSGVAVSGSWSGGYTGSASCTTDSTGKCTVISGNIRKNLNSVTYTITDMTKAGTVYAPAANHDPDGDSDGTSITVNRP